MIYRLFVYKILDTLTDSPNDLSLEWKLPVDESLAFNIGMSFLTYSQISKNIYMLLQKKLKKINISLHAAASFKQAFLLLWI